MPDTPEYGYIDGPVYSTNKYGYSTRPMSDTQAISLLQRLADVLKYRMNLSKPYNTQNPGTRRWRDNMKPDTGIQDKTQRQLYEDQLVGLNASLNTINSLKDGSSYNIAAHEVSVQQAEEGDPPIYPEGEDPTDPVANAKFIIKSIDGIAIINTILNINDIRNQYFGEPDGSQFANGLINNAYRAYRKVDETYNKNKNYPWKNQRYQNEKYVKHYTVNRVEQMCVYPHFVDKDDPNRSTDKWYDFTGKFYKYANTVNILAGSAGHSDYVGLMPAEFKTNDYGFNFTADFSSITGHVNQKTYILDVLNSIAPKNNGSAQPVQYDFVKYVKDFANDYIKTNTKKPNNLYPISAAFDYFLIDYLIQILESEYELYVTLLDNYKWASSTEIALNSDLERAQYNDAPFYYSSCNGASCVGLCYGSCVNTCNGCGGCTGYCSTSCGGTCRTTCANNCENDCGKDCGTACMNACDNSCIGDCKMDCTTVCSDGCKNGCKNGCFGCSDTCLTGCKDTCNDGCKKGCNNTCGGSCKGDCGDSCHYDGTNPVTTTTVQNSSYGYSVQTRVEQVTRYSIDANGNRVRYTSNDVVAVTGPNGSYATADRSSNPIDNSQTGWGPVGGNNGGMSDYMRWSNSQQSGSSDD